MRHHRVEEMYGIQCFSTQTTVSFHQEARFPATVKMHFLSQFAHTWLVREPLVLAVSQLVQIGTAGKVDHGGWAAHQDLSKHSHFFILGSREFGIDVLKCNRQCVTRLSSEGGKSAFSIISALMKPELYFHPSPGLWS